MIEDIAPVGPHTTCLVLAAAGSIGSLLVQMAHQRGARVVAAVSSQVKAEVARRHGADVVIEYRDGRFADVALEATNGRGADITFDSVGATTLRESFRATRTRGMVVNYGSVAGAVRDLDPLELGEAGSLFLTRPRLADYIASREDLARRASAIFGALAAGDLHVTMGGEFGFETLREAHAALEERRQIGKAILRVTSEGDFALR